MPQLPASNQTSVQDLVIQFRYRTLMILGGATLPFLLPFSINSFIQDRQIMGLLTMLIVMIASINSFAIFHHRQPLIPFSAFYAVVVVTLIFGMSTLGVKATFWCYPVAFVVLFIAERSDARIMIGITMLTLVPAVFYFLTPEIAVRFTITLGMICFFSDRMVALLSELQSRLTEMAIRDPLTGAFNRRRMASCLMDAMEESKRGFGRMSVVALDIDHFKKINDTLGHEAGDKVLKDLVSTLQKRQRKLDYIFRIGGEEFLILLRNTKLTQAATFAENLRKHVEKTKLLEGWNVTVSLGIAEYEIGEDEDEWLKRADTNLYEAKRSGRNRVHPPAAI